jgi:3-hydroxyisobutyrate dehydrogenase-like beta-hydroxyacid dehydrogenase
MTERPVKTAVVGLGNMGEAILQRIAASGPVTGFDIDASRRQAAERIDQATIFGDLADLSDHDVVILSLPSPAISLSVITDLVGVLRPGSTIIETSTVLPDDVHAERRIVESNGGRLIDAAVFSGVAGMRSGAAKLLVGGVRDRNDPITAVLERISSDLLFFDNPGAGMAAKVINNAVAHAVMVVLAEAAGLADAYDISGDSLTALLSDPEGGVMRPLTHRYVERVRSGSYEGGMPVTAALKDSKLALALAQAQGVPLFAIQGSHTVYELAKVAGLGQKDYASIATLWEGWQDTSFAN